MTDNALVVVSNANPVMVSIRDVSYDNVQKMMELEDQQFSMFPGKAYTYKKGHWFEGYGKDAPLVDKLFASKSVIINAPNINFAWRIFSDEGRPQYIAFANPCLGQRLPDRKSLGHTDKELWEVKEFNGVAKAMDPISKIAMLPFRFDGEKEVNHLMITSWSGVKAVQSFLKDYAKDGRSHPGKLPVVNLGSKLERHWEDDTVTFEIPTFELADWEVPIAEDEPEGSIKADALAGGTTVEIPAYGGVKASSRTEQTVEQIKQDATRTTAPVNAMKEAANAGGEADEDDLFNARGEPEKVPEQAPATTTARRSATAAAPIGGGGTQRRGLAAAGTTSRR
jgi:hypothetical protein